MLQVCVFPPGTDAEGPSFPPRLLAGGPEPQRPEAALNTGCVAYLDEERVIHCNKRYLVSCGSIGHQHPTMHSQSSFVKELH